MTAFISLLQLLRSDFTDDERVIIACPSQEQVQVPLTTNSKKARPFVLQWKPLNVFKFHFSHFLNDAL